MADPATCTNDGRTCPAETYCPATEADVDPVECAACNVNCTKCEGAANTCQECKTGFYLEDTTCTDCSGSDSNCTACTSADTCTACADGFGLNGKDCVKSCEKSEECDAGSFCDLKAKICSGKCSDGCTKCYSEKVCGACADGKVVNIFGVCEEACTDVEVGQYCKAGAASDCAAGITQQCNCGGSAANCASCVEGEEKCDACLPGFMKEGEECKQCADGYEAYETLCVMPGGSESSAKLSVGAIIGIVVGVLVVVGGVGGGLAYYFIKKNKK